MANIIIEKNHGKKYVDAIREVIDGGGNHLILAYGYIEPDAPLKEKGVYGRQDYKPQAARAKDKIPQEIFFCIKEFLKRSSNNKVDVIIGISNQRQIAAMANNFKWLLGSGWFETGISERIHVFGIPDFHSKYSMMLRSSATTDTIAISALMGSSNLSKTALENNNRFEMDLLMTGAENNKTLQDFHKVASKQLATALKNEVTTLGSLVEGFIHGTPLEKFILNADNKKMQNYYYETDSEEERAALMDSDNEQEVSYNNK